MPDTHPILDRLTQPDYRRSIDPLDMLGLVLKFPEQCRQAIQIGKSLEVKSPPEQEVREIVVTALGGSAIGGDFARALADQVGTVPLIVNRDYSLPHWVGPHTLVIAGSYSGNTEETLAAYANAQSAGAQIAVITSGGMIKELAEADGHTVALVPGGQPPRSATGYMFFPMLALLSKLGLLAHDFERDIDEMLERLDKLAADFGPEVPAERNPAKQLAIALSGKLPVVYGTQGYRGAVAVRWKGQFNENAKQAAFANVFPEQNHNEILAWTLATRQAQNWSVILLRDPAEISETPRIARRVEVTRELIAPSAEIHEVWAEGKSLLARMFHLIYFADFVTVYLAYLNDICPTDIGSIDHLKEELSKL